MVHIDLQKKSSFVLVDCRHVAGPDAQVVGLDGMRPRRVVEIPVVLRKLQAPENLVEQNVEVLNDIAVTGLPGAFKFQGYLKTARN